MNLIFTLYEDHMGIHRDSFKSCLHFTEDVQEAFSKVTK